MTMTAIYIQPTLVYVHFRITNGAYNNYHSNNNNITINTQLRFDYEETNYNTIHYNK